MLIVAAATDTATALAQRTTQQAAQEPNVVLVTMDDLGYGDLASYGATDVRTANIDRLAREGVRLTDAYANGQVCSPTRAALISGQYPQWHLGFRRDFSPRAQSGQVVLTMDLTASILAATGTKAPGTYH